jgi:hypothetical protein
VICMPRRVTALFRLVSSCFGNLVGAGPALCFAATS